MLKSAAGYRWTAFVLSGKPGREHPTVEIALCDCSVLAVYSVVKMMKLGGTVDVESQVGVGTTIVSKNHGSPSERHYRYKPHRKCDAA